MSDKKASLSIDGKTLDLKVHSGTIGPDVIEVSALTGNGYFTYDPGFVSTAACESKITYIDGDKGVLLHGGYPIEQLAEQKLVTSYFTAPCQTQRRKKPLLTRYVCTPWSTTK